jgi:hypothetical protein
MNDMRKLVLLIAMLLFPVDTFAKLENYVPPPPYIESVIFFFSIFLIGALPLALPLYFLHSHFDKETCRKNRHKWLIFSLVILCLGSLMASSDMSYGCYGGTYLILISIPTLGLILSSSFHFLNHKLHKDKRFVFSFLMYPLSFLGLILAFWTIGPFIKEIILYVKNAL